MGKELVMKWSRSREALSSFWIGKWARYENRKAGIQNAVILPGKNIRKNTLAKSIRRMSIQRMNIQRRSILKKSIRRDEYPEDGYLGEGILRRKVSLKTNTRMKIILQKIIQATNILKMNP